MLRALSPSAAVRSPPLVLVADDEPNNRLLLSAVLAEVACEVVTCEDGPTLLSVARERLPSTVLLDVNMPGLDGFEVCRRLKSDSSLRLVPVLMVTALGDVQDRVRALEAGADDFVTKPFAAAEVIARVRSFLRLAELFRALDQTEQVVMALARAVEARDAYTDQHALRVARSSVRIGRLAGLGEADLSALWMAASIHDIGKIGIPDAILAKPGPLNPEETELMRRHVEVGAEIAGPLRSADLLVPVIRHHHERWDGAGYPSGLSRTAIPIEARMVAIADSYDALTSDRPYRHARSLAEARAILEAGAGTQWDPELVSLFMQADPAPAVTPG